MVIFSEQETVPLASGAVKQTFALSSIPEQATSVNVYKSYDGNSFSLASSVQTGGADTATVTQTENDSWTYVWYKTTITDRNGKETPVTGAPTKQVYVVGSEGTLPGYGRGGYGWQPYGG
jgi:hypothetical protein